MPIGFHAKFVSPRQEQQHSKNAIAPSDCRIHLAGLQISQRDSRAGKWPRLGTCALFAHRSIKRRCRQRLLARNSPRGPRLPQLLLRGCLWRNWRWRLLLSPRCPAKSQPQRQAQGRSPNKEVSILGR